VVCLEGLGGQAVEEGSCPPICSTGRSINSANAAAAPCFELLQLGSKLALGTGLTIGSMYLAMFCSYALALWYGGQRVAAGAVAGRLSPGITWFAPDAFSPRGSPVQIHTI
jgi:hypothetical protein